MQGSVTLTMIEDYSASVILDVLSSVTAALTTTVFVYLVSKNYHNISFIALMPRMYMIILKYLLDSQMC